MRITDPYRVSMAAGQKVRRRRRVGGVAETGNAAPPTDQVFFSERSADVSKARSLALSAPEIRVDLVDAISLQISSGQYTASGSDVVPKLIEEHLVTARA